MDATKLFLMRASVAQLFGEMMPVWENLVHLREEEGRVVQSPLTSVSVYQSRRVRVMVTYRCMARCS